VVGKFVGTGVGTGTLVGCIVVGAQVVFTTSEAGQLKYAGGLYEFVHTVEVMKSQ
jgi:hypothetical protein